MNAKSDLNPQTVFVVEDNPAMRGALRDFFVTAGLDVRSFDSAEAFLAGYTEDQSGCLVLDIKLPAMSGVDLQKHLLKLGVRLPVIMVSGHAKVIDAVNAMKMGAFEFIPKPYPSDLLLERVRQALAQDLSSRLSRRLMQNLTDRERQILALVVSGLQSKAIADKLQLTVSTVDNHRANIMKKLAVGSIADLVRFVMKNDPDLVQEPLA
jgi:two-component system, LuxR family, response regulator FixJ